MHEDGLLLHLVTALGPFTPGIIGSVEAIAELAEIGVTFLMFVVGVQLPLRELARASRTAILGGLLQVAAMVGIGYLVGRASMNPSRRCVER